MAINPLLANTTPQTNNTNTIVKSDEGEAFNKTFNAIQKKNLDDKNGQVQNFKKVSSAKKVDGTTEHSGKLKPAEISGLIKNSDKMDGLEEPYVPNHDFSEDSEKLSTLPNDMLTMVTNIHQHMPKIESSVTDKKIFVASDDKKFTAVGKSKVDELVVAPDLRESPAQSVDTKLFDTAISAEPEADSVSLKSFKHQSESSTVSVPSPALQQPITSVRDAFINIPIPIAPRMGQAGWGEAVGQKVVWMVTESIQSATLTLNPPDLGPVQVVLSVTNDQASASFSTAQPETQQALEQAMPKLREMMSDAGITLNNTSVDLGFSNHSNQQSSQSTSKSSRNSDSPLDIDTNTPELSLKASAQGIGLINTFA